MCKFKELSGQERSRFWNSTSNADRPLCLISGKAVPASNHPQRICHIGRLGRVAGSCEGRLVLNNNLGTNHVDPLYLPLVPGWKPGRCPSCGKWRKYTSPKMAAWERELRRIIPAELMGLKHLALN